jgi:hypothetical protein
VTSSRVIGRVRCLHENRSFEDHLGAHHQGLSEKTSLNLVAAKAPIGIRRFRMNYESRYTKESDP